MRTIIEKYEVVERPGITASPRWAIIAYVYKGTYHIVIQDRALFKCRACCARRLMYLPTGGSGIHILREIMRPFQCLPGEEITSQSLDFGGQTSHSMNDWAPPKKGPPKRPRARCSSFFRGAGLGVSGSRYLWTLEAPAWCPFKVHGNSFVLDGLILSFPVVLSWFVFCEYGYVCKLLTALHKILQAGSLNHLCTLSPLLRAIDRGQPRDNLTMAAISADPRPSL